MVTVHQDNCPLCNTTAEFDYIDRHNGQYFDCECCKDILATRRAMREPIPEGKRHEWSKLSASLNDGQFLFIDYVQHEHKENIESKSNLPKFGVN